MNLDFFILNGYGQYIWPAFLITFTSCFVLFLKTKKDLKRLEKILLQQHKQLKVIKVQIATKENRRKILSRSSIF
jgi:heme exporter protein CcmD